MAISASNTTDWDIDFYKTDYECDEHWELRKRFMTLHKDKFPEDELVCLAQVFTNIEFMGCKYPDETMMLVAQLSADVANEFRQQRAGRLKRTFVKASDAAEARAKEIYSGRYTDIENTKDNNTFHITTVLSQTKISSYNSDEDRETRPCFGKDEIISDWSNAGTTKFGFQISENFFKPLANEHSSHFPGFGSFNTSIGHFNADIDKPIKLFDDQFPFGRFILYLSGDRNALYISGAKCEINVSEKHTVITAKEKIKVDILVGGVIASSIIAPTIKEAKTKAYDAAIKKLDKSCYVIKPNPNPDRIDIKKTKNDDSLVAVVAKNVTKSDNLKLDSNNIGYRMMQKLGWTGGGLGAQTQGREDPVEFFLKQNRLGLGHTNDTNTTYFRKLLTSYIQSDDIRDLHFESNFTKSERVSLHQIANSKNLKSSSHGKDGRRHLVISKKNISPYQIINEVLVRRNPIYVNKYEVKVPVSMAAVFPDHVEFKKLIKNPSNQMK